MKVELYKLIDTLDHETLRLIYIFIFEFLHIKRADL